LYDLHTQFNIRCYPRNVSGVEQKMQETMFNVPLKPNCKGFESSLVHYMCWCARHAAGGVPAESDRVNSQAELLG